MRSLGLSKPACQVTSLNDRKPCESQRRAGTGRVFEVMLRAVVRVRATNKEIARTAVSSLLSSPGRIQIDLANQSNAAVGRPAMVTDVDLVQESDPKPR